MRRNQRLRLRRHIFSASIFTKLNSRHQQPRRKLKVKSFESFLMSNGENLNDLQIIEEDELPSSTTETTATKLKDTAMNVAGTIGDKTGIPAWGVVAIFILVALIILGICGFCIRRFFKKRRSKDGKKGMKGVDLKSVQLLGSAYKEKVNIIMSMGVWLSI